MSAAMTSAGLVSIILGVLLGMIPGCGPQVIFVSLYLKGIFPFAALLANTISQDGDALFPLFALHPRAALLGTASSTPGSGILAYCIELGFSKIDTGTDLPLFHYGLVDSGMVLCSMQPVIRLALWLFLTRLPA